jgi:hypothetical protein
MKKSLLLACWPWRKLTDSCRSSTDTVNYRQLKQTVPCAQNYGKPRAITEEFVRQCREWVSTEFDPETGNMKKCTHSWCSAWKRAPLDGTMHCTKCGLYGGNSH